MQIYRIWPDSVSLLIVRRILFIKPTGKVKFFLFFTLWALTGSLVGSGSASAGLSAGGTSSLSRCGTGSPAASARLPAGGLLPSGLI